MDANDFADRLSGVKKSGQGYTAKCPAHDDKKPSLSFQDGEKRLLVTCHKGCTPGAIMAALDLKLSDLYFDSPNDSLSRSKIVCTYPYKSEDADLLYEIVRREDKTFSVRRPDGKSGWIWNLSDTKRVLYRLPDLRGRETVYIVEGEKDADRLWKEDLPTTCNVFGAGKWKEEFTRQLLDAGVRAVIVLPDNEPTGINHADSVARSCFAVGLEVTLLPPLVEIEGGDVSDYFEGHTLFEFIEIVNETPPLKEAPKLSKEKSAGGNKKNDRTHYTAKAPGLIDIAEEGGENLFLMKNEEGEIVAEEFLTIEDETYAPPSRDQLPYLLPRASEVLRHFKEDEDKPLYLDLVSYHKFVSALPLDAHYHLLGHLGSSHLPSRRSSV